jgi:hypothetical protein
MGGHTGNVGRAGEYFVAHCLESRGIRVMRVDTEGDDLWCRVRGGRLLSVQVKSCSVAKPDRHGRLTYIFRDTQRSSCRSDVYAFVAMDRLLVLFEARMGISRRIGESAFTSAAMDASIARFFG